MNDTITENFGGFDENAIQASVYLYWKYSVALERLEWGLRNFAKKSCSRPSSRMDLSLTKCYEDTASSNTSFKGVVTDNDSGYMSQNVESNSSVETAGENRQTLVPVSDLKDVYLNEDTLLEKPQIFVKQPMESEDYEEYGHLFYMSTVTSTSMLNSSATSQKTNFSGFEGDESGVSDVSSIIPVATPIVVSSNVLYGESETDNDICRNQSNLSQNGQTLEQNTFVEPLNESELNDAKENSLNNANIESNLKLINNSNESLCDKSANSTFEYENNLNSIETRMKDANNYNMSSFESFYSFVCDLYTKNDAPLEVLSNVSINPHNLQINPYNLQMSHGLESKQQNNKRINHPIVSKCNSTNNSPTKKYLELETRSKLVVNAMADSAIENSNKAVSNNQGSGSTSGSVAKSGPPVKQRRFANPPLSPELFSDEEPEPSENLSRSLLQIKKTCDEMYITKNDRKLLKRARESLGGVPPPPSFTILQMTAAEMLEKFLDNKHLFSTNFGGSANHLNVNNLECCVNNEQKGCVNSDKVNNLGDANKEKLKNKLETQERKSLLVTCKKEDVNMELWPNLMQYRFHGLHYNRSKVSEEFEHLCLKYAERYIGAETQSSCTVFGIDVGSPSKRKFKLRRPAKSPGKRLSHLARRRITFSKDSLHSGVGPTNCSFIGSRTRQIMVDARKFELLSRRRSPRKRSPRKTPGKSPRRKSRTPSSSSKKQFPSRLKRYNTGDSMDSVSSASSSRASVTKRALFQSPPDKGECSNNLLQLLGANTSDSDLSESSRRPTPRRALFTSPLRTSPTKMSISSLYPAKRKMTPKRALFKSPGKAASPSGHMDNCDKKRKRTDNDDTHPNKIARSVSSDSSNESKVKSVMRSHSSSGSSSLQSQDIAQHRKKKLMWAVAEALRSQNVDLKHPQFKVFASVLARVIRHFLPNLFTNGPRPEGSTTESMLRIARQYVFGVTRGKTVDQIIREAAQANRLKVTKPSGYVGLDQVDKIEDVSHRNKENVLQDRVNTISSNRTISENNQINKSRRGENVERIRRVINFGDDDDSTGVR